MSIIPTCMRDLPPISPGETQCVRHVDLFTDEGPVCKSMTGAEFVKEYGHTFRTLSANPHNEPFNQASQEPTSGLTSIATGLFSSLMFGRGTRVISSLLPNRFANAFMVLNIAAMMSQIEGYQEAVAVVGTASLAKEIGKKLVKYFDPVADILADPLLMAYH